MFYIRTQLVIKRPLMNKAKKYIETHGIPLLHTEPIICTTIINTLSPISPGYPPFPGRPISPLTPPSPLEPGSPVMPFGPYIIIVNTKQDSVTKMATS